MKKNYNYLTKRANIRKLDGSYKMQKFYGNTVEELESKIKEKQDKAELAYQKEIKPLFSKVADEWNESHSDKVSHYTYICYQAPLKDLKNEFSGALLEEITPLDIQRYLNKLEKQGYAKQTIKLRKITASLIFDFAILEKNIIRYNPVSPVKVGKNAPVKERQLPSDEDINIVKNSVDKPFGLYAYLLYYTGCRREEALALSYEDIDFKNDLISINKVLIFKYGKPTIELRAKSKSGIRDIPLLVPLKNVLDKHKKGYIFVNENNELLTLSQFNMMWNSYVKATGIKSTSHQMRHAFATLCFDAGLQEKDAAQILGHSKVELTQNIYTHIRESRKKQSANKLNAFLKSG